LFRDIAVLFHLSRSHTISLNLSLSTLMPKRSLLSSVLGFKGATERTITTSNIDGLPVKIKDYIQHKEIRVQKVYMVLARSKSELERVGQPGSGSMTMQGIANRSTEMFRAI
jgi:hypothetical protein